MVIIKSTQGCTEEYSGPHSKVLRVVLKRTQRRTEEYSGSYVCLVSTVGGCQK
jgi:hypothetical protein